MNYEEILIWLKNNAKRVSYFAFDEISYPAAIGEVEEIYQKGGEDEGSHWEVVFHFKTHNVYIKAEGSYSSYDGTEFYNEWESVSQVFPGEKTIIVYE